MLSVWSNLASDITIAWWDVCISLHNPNNDLMLYYTCVKGDKECCFQFLEHGTNNGDSTITKGIRSKSVFNAPPKYLKL